MTDTSLNRNRIIFVVELLLALLVNAMPLLHLPLDWFQTFFHEFSHGLAALLTSGRIETISIAFDASGKCLTRGGFTPLILFSGYAGSAVWGTLIYLSVSARHAKKIALGLGLFVCVVGLLWVRDWTTPWILLCIVAMFLLAYRYGSRKWTHRFVELTGLYVVLEAIRSPTYLFDGKRIGDGGALAALTHIPEFVWIGVWIIMAAGLAVFLFQRSTRATR